MDSSMVYTALAAKGTVAVALTNPHDPTVFYETRAGLDVCTDYRHRIVRHATPTQSASPVMLRRFILDRNATDEDIEAALGQNHVFMETEVCWIVAEMIAKQQKGKPGDLLNIGYANLFYTPSWVVDIRWFAVGREWRVLTWRRGDSDWIAGSSAFSRN